jgi:hypothetical protein
VRFAEHDEWSRDSRRIDPMSRSTWSFCPGERGAVGDLGSLWHEYGLQRVLMNLVMTSPMGLPLAVARVMDTLIGRSLGPG